MSGWRHVEQHKVLLIIVSVTIVLAAVVGVGLWLFYPRAADDGDLAQGGAPESGGYEWQPLDYLQGQGDVPGLDEDESDRAGEPDEFEVTYGVVQDAADGDTAGEPTADRPTVIDTADRAPSAEATDVPGPGVQSASPGPTDSAGTSAARETGTAGSDVSTAADSTSQPRVSETPSTAATLDRTDLADRAYWVQAISSPNRDTVEQAKLTLREHQLGSRIITKVIDDRTYYRLRIGPFAVRAEAEKFLGWVQEIDDFVDAMIFVDYTTPVLAARPG